MNYRCECGLSYVPGSPEDEQQHSRIHTEYDLGPAIAELCHVPRIGLIGDLPVHVVDSSVLCADRYKLAYVAMVAQRSMSSYPAGYDGTITVDDQHLYVVADKARAVAFVLTALEGRFWHLRWKQDGSIDLVEQMATLRRGYKISRVWVAARYRRKGLSNALIRLSAGHLNTEIADLGWELPFTESGTRLVQKLAPHEFWGCGDTYVISKVLHPESIRALPEVAKS